MRFVLVHGGNHGAWCWDRLIPVLESRGHSAIAMDLPGHGRRQDEPSTASGYRDAVTEVLEPGDVLVGHSMGFWVATMAADAFPDIRHIVSVAGRLPVEGQPVIPAQRQQGSEAVGPMSRSSADTLMRISADGTTFSYDKEAASAVFFHDCDPEDIDWACKQLTPQRIDILLNEPVSIPTFWETQLPRSCIRCLDDRIMMQETYDATIRRLGVEGLNINASHSPFISRPGEFADLLVAAVQTTPIGPLLPY